MENKLKFDETSVQGIFLGWKLAYGSTWQHMYYVCAIEDFEPDMLLKNNLDAHYSVIPQDVSSVWPVFHNGGWDFPIRQRYDYTNHTLLGRAKAQEYADEKQEQACAEIGTPVPDSDLSSEAEHEFENGDIEVVVDVPSEPIEVPETTEHPDESVSANAQNENAVTRNVTVLRGSEMKRAGVENTTVDLTLSTPGAEKNEYFLLGTLLGIGKNNTQFPW